MFSSALAYHRPGRLRVRDCRWREREALDAVVRTIGAIGGVERVEPNLKAGSVVVLYDPERLPPSALLARLAPLFGEEEAAAVNTRAAGGWTVSALPEVSAEANRLAKIGLLATTGVTIAALRFNRHVHAAAGWTGLAFLAAHLLHNRRKLWR